MTGLPKINLLCADTLPTAKTNILPVKTQKHWERPSYCCEDSQNVWEITLEILKKIWQRENLLIQIKIKIKQVFPSCQKLLTVNYRHYRMEVNAAVHKKSDMRQWE